MCLLLGSGVRCTLMLYALARGVVLAAPVSVSVDFCARAYTHTHSPLVTIVLSRLRLSPRQRINREVNWGLDTN